jgi:NAD(P)-dependent dehydrogenase (short-subunit alcohol dehydrogenase family)
LKEKLILITGSTDGIGKETALELINLGAHVIIHGRSQKKVELTIKEIKNKTNSNSISGIDADLGSFDQIIKMSNKIYEEFDRLDILINNAGVFKPERHITQEGLEETFAINYIAPFLLTNLLLDQMKNKNSMRIVNVASQVHSNHIDLNNLQFESKYTGTKAYAQSKTCLILFTYYLAEKLKNSNITVNCLHPGIINTKLLKEAMGINGGITVSKGAEALIYVAMAPELENVTGKYFTNNIPEPSKAITYNKEIQKKLWLRTEEIIRREFKN